MAVLFLVPKRVAAITTRRVAPPMQSSSLVASCALRAPRSWLTALAMTQNGAEGKTLSEMQKVLGGLDRDTLNAYMNSYLAAVAGKGLFDLRSPNDPCLGRSSLVRDR